MKKITILLSLALFIFQNCENKIKNTSEVLEKQKVIKRSIEIATPTDEIIDEFYQAIFDNDNKKVEQMLGTKFPALYKPKNKISPLQAVIWSSDNLYLTKLFVEKGVKFSDNKARLIVVAAEYGRLKIIEYFIAKGADVKNNEAFNKAGFHQFYDCAKLLLLNGANQKIGDSRGKLWFYEQAVIKSDYEVLDKLDLSNDELNHNNCNGESALIIAVKQNNLEMVRYLLNRNVDKDKPETFDCGDDIHYGDSPIQIARKNNYNEIITLLN